MSLYKLFRFTKDKVDNRNEEFKVNPPNSFGLAKEVEQRLKSCLNISNDVIEVNPKSQIEVVLKISKPELAFKSFENYLMKVKECLKDFASIEVPQQLNIWFRNKSSDAFIEITKEEENGFLHIRCFRK